MTATPRHLRRRRQDQGRRSRRGPRLDGRRGALRPGVPPPRLRRGRRAGTCSPTTRCWSWPSTRSTSPRPSSSSSPTTTASSSSTTPPRSSAAGTGWPSDRQRPTHRLRARATAPMRRAVAFAGNIKDSKQRRRAVPRDRRGATHARPTEDDGQLPRVRGRARRRHLQRPRAQRRCSTGSRRTPGREHLPHPHQRPLPVRRRRRPGAGRGDVPHPAQVRRRHRPVGRPGHAPGRGQEVRLHHPARSASRPA